MSNATFANVVKEQQHLRNAQIVRYNYTYPINVTVPNNGNRLATIIVDQDADFFAKQLTGKVIGPTDSNGARLVNQPTNFPMPGTLMGWADSGVQVKIFDGGSGYDLTDGFVNVETIFTPGYGVQFHIPFAWPYYIRRNSKLNWEFANRDASVGIAPIAGATLYHFVGVALNGYKYTGVTK